MLVALELDQLDNVASEIQQEKHQLDEMVVAGLETLAPPARLAKSRTPNRLGNGKLRQNSSSMRRQVGSPLFPRLRTNRKAHLAPAHSSKLRSSEISRQTSPCADSGDCLNEIFAVVMQPNGTQTDTATGPRPRCDRLHGPLQRSSFTMAL